MKINFNPTTNPPADPPHLTAPSAATSTLTGLGNSFAFKSVFPLKLPNGMEFTAADAMRLGGLNPDDLKLGPVSTLPSAPPPVRKHILGAAPLPVGHSVVPGLATPRIVSPRLAATRSDNPRLLQGLRDFTTFFTTHCGKGVKLANDLAWLGHDFIVFYRDLKDPDVGTGEHVVEIADLSSSVLSVLGAITGSGRLDQASGSLHFASVIGGHFNSGKVALSQSELVSLSALPDAEEYSAMLDATELMQAPR
jgi:hypothetical protein